MTDQEFLIRRLVCSGSCLIYWGGVWVQARRVRKRIGRSPNLKPQGTKEKLLWLGWFLVIATWLGQPLLFGSVFLKPALTFFSALLHPVGLAFGLLLVVAGYAGTLWSYAAMGDAWRIGINEREKNVLISGGPYRWIRHPIYSFQVVMLAGVALLLPTPLSFVVLLTHYVCVVIKASDEEKYLISVHGEGYRDYLGRTGRLFPKLI
jgi:protein-S-isoprenylcysteine O-methyltransferase Ste14